MALYLGSSEKQKIILNGATYLLNMFTQTIDDGIRLLSSDDYILRDSNGLYLKPKESES